MAEPDSFVETVPEEAIHVLKAAAEAMADGRPCALVTVIGVGGSTPRRGGARMLVYDDGSIIGTVGGGQWEYVLIQEALESIAKHEIRRIARHLTRDLGMCCGGAMEAFIEPLEVVPALVIYGAGHVGAATARVAAALGFHVHVVDERDDILAEAVLPDSVIRHEADPRRLLPDLPRGSSSYHLVVTHDHGLDQDIIEMLLPQSLAWLGLIGSRSKVAKFFVRYRAAGIDPSLFTRLSAPVGLDIGAQTPEEIAVSIAAELVAVRRGVDQPYQAKSAAALPARGGAVLPASLRESDGPAQSSD